jgi:hypothetical protein
VVHQAGTTALNIAVLVLLAAMVGLLVSVLYGTAYTLEPGRLRARCGPFTSTVPLASVGSVVSTRNPLSGPALSLDRLAIRGADGRTLLLVSPRDRAGFLRELVRLEPAMRRRADGLVRNG